MHEDIFVLLGIFFAIGISFLINHIKKYVVNISCKKNIIIEISILLLFISISIIIVNYLYGNIIRYGFSVFYQFLPMYSLYNIVRCILNRKKMYLKQIAISLLQFFIINIILSLIVSLYIWNIREIDLIRITKLTNYTFSYVYIRINFYLCIISFIIVELVNLVKYLHISKNIYFRLIPLKIIIIYIFLLFTNGWDGICLWDILSDTRYSDNFEIQNIDKIVIGMEKEEVIEFIGEPLYKYDNDEYRWTGDGKNWEQNISVLFLRKDFAWFHFEIIFKDNKVYEINSFWAYD